MLPILTVISILIGGWIFAAISGGYIFNAKVLTQPSMVDDKQFTLWALILLIFFPTNNVASSFPLSKNPNRLT